MNNNNSLSFNNNSTVSLDKERTDIQHFSSSNNGEVYKNDNSKKELNINVDKEYDDKPQFIFLKKKQNNNLDDLSKVLQGNKNKNNKDVLFSTNNTNNTSISSNNNNSSSKITFKKKPSYGIRNNNNISVSNVSNVHNNSTNNSNNNKIRNTIQNNISGNSNTNANNNRNVSNFTNANSNTRIYQRNNNRNNNMNHNNSLFKNELEDLKNRSKYELMNEAFYIANLFYIMNQTTWSNLEDDYYIISQGWFEKWKTYTNFDYLISKTKYILSDKKEDREFFKETEPLILDQIVKHFESTMLISNSSLFPGQVSNSGLIYERSLHLADDHTTSSHLNYNIKDNLIEGQDFIVVSQTIWKYFYNIYGGIEIKRYSIRVSPTKNVVEIMLKNLLVTTTRIRNSKIDTPKLCFFSRADNIKSLKKHLVSLLSHTQEKEYQSKNYRLWALDSTFTVDIYETHLISSLKQNENEYLENISFPGVILDKFENDLIGEIEDLINDKLIILEYKKPSATYYNPKNNFIFKKEKINYIDNHTKISIIDRYQNNHLVDAIGVDNYFSTLCLNKISFYDDYSKFDYLTINKKDDYKENVNSLFPLKKFFSLKYGVNVFNEEFFIEYKKTDDYKRELTDIYNKEVEVTKGNLEEIYEKSEIINKFSVFFSKIDKSLVSEPSKINSHVKKNTEDKIQTRYQQIMSKRSLNNKVKESLIKSITHNMNDDNEVNGTLKNNYYNADKGCEEANNDNKDNNLQSNYTNDIDCNEDLMLNENKKIENTIGLTSLGGRNLNNIKELEKKKNTGNSQIESFYDVDIESSNDKSNNVVGLYIKNNIENIKHLKNCSYCNKEITNEVEAEFCNLCLVTYYCNIFCLNRDKKFHKKKCSK